jgi:predicted CXXCH cytochrome family protein
MTTRFPARALCLAAALLVFAGSLPGDPAAAPAPVPLVSPRERAFLCSGELYVICKGDTGDLAVDGAARPWGAFAEPLHVARLRLAPGAHELRVGGRKVAVCIAEEGQKAPAGWEAYRLHPIEAGADACARCHETGRREGRTEVKAAKPSTACLECHNGAEFEAKHSHPLDPLKHCASCHAPHGSPNQGLLKGPVKKLCAECHES